jgi:hypothetical protein
MTTYHAEPFLSNTYSEDQYAGLREAEYDAAMAEFASDNMSDGDPWEGYGQWSQDVENLYVASDGAVKHRPEPKSLGRIGGIEL